MEIEPLIERCRHGEEDALSELYKAYAPKLRSVCRRYISNEEMVNDALHDAFVVIFTSFDTLREDSKAEAWMVSIASYAMVSQQNVKMSHRKYLG